MINIIVCIKQVPASSEVKIDPNTGTLIRDGNNTKMNPYDLYALEIALQIKEKYGAYIKVITMGPPNAKAVLFEALWMGADEAMIVSDRKFGGADVLATSYTLCSGIKKLGDFDLIICGKQTTDGDTAQVGPEIAEHLHIPHISYVNEIIDVSKKDNNMIVNANMDKTIDKIEVKMPALLTIDKIESLAPRLPSYKRGRNMNNEIQMITFLDLIDKDENHYGLKGSSTQVEKMFSPSKNDMKEVLKGNIDEQVNSLINIFKDKKII